MVEFRDDRRIRDLAATVVLVRSRQCGSDAVRSEHSVGTDHRRQLSRRHRRNFAAARAADDAARTAGRFILVGRDSGSVEGILRLHADAAGRHARRFHLSRLLSVLCLLGSDARADVFPHRRLGWSSKTLRRNQVFPVHALWIGASAVRHSGFVLHVSGHCGSAPGNRKPVRNRRNIRCSGIPCDGAVSAVQFTVLDLPRVLRRIRDQGSDVPLPHMAAGRARRGANCRFGYSCGRPAEDGDLRIFAIQPADSAGRHKILRSADDHVIDHCDRLWRARRDDAAGYEEARRLLFRESHGFRDARHVCAQSEWRERKHHPADQPRYFDRRAVPDRRHHLRAPAHA